MKKKGAKKIAKKNGRCEHLWRFSWSDSSYAVYKCRHCGERSHVDKG